MNGSLVGFKLIFYWMLLLTAKDKMFCLLLWTEALKMSGFLWKLFQFGDTRRFGRHKINDRNIEKSKP